jgi:hypothetical protein
VSPCQERECEKNVIIIWCLLRTSTTIVGGTPL